MRPPSHSPFNSSPASPDSAPLDLALTGGKVGLWDWNIATGEVQWTDAVYAIHGVAREGFAITLENYLGLVHPDDRARVQEATRASLEREAPYDHEFRIVRPDGKIAWIFTNATVVRENGRPVRMIGATVDITARRHADDVSRWLAAIVDSSDDAIISKDLNSIITSWNSGAQRLYGYTAREVIGRPVSILIPDGRKDEEAGLLERLSQGERVEHYETVRRRKDGSLVEVSLTVSPVKDAAGRIVGASKIARDISERRRSQDALRASEERFRLLTNHAPVGIFLTDESGGCVFVNSRWKEMAGIPASRALGTGWAAALHPDDRERVLFDWNRAVERDQPAFAEFRFLRPDGSIIWTHASAVRLVHGGIFHGYLGSCVDITQRKEDELQMEFLHRLADRVSALSRPDEIMAVSQAALGEFLGVDRCYFFEVDADRVVARIGRDWHRPHLPPVTGAHRLAAFGSAEFGALLAKPRCAISDLLEHPATRSHASSYATLRMRALATAAFRQDGRWRLSLAIAHRQPRNWTAAELDVLENVAVRVGPIIERARTSQALEQSERQLRLVTDHAPVFLAHCDRDHRFKFVNQPYAERYGLARDEIIGKHVSKVTGPEAYATFGRHMDACLAGRRIEFEQEIPYRDLGRRWVHVTYEPERGPDGEVIGLVAVIVDITTRKQAELELARARDAALASSRTKDEFLASLSHELRTPLNPVLLLASDAANNPALPLDVRDTFETIRRNISLEARLIDDLLDLTRIARGKLQLEKTRVAVHGVIHDAVANVRSEIEGKHLNLQLFLGARDPVVVGDAVRLQQVFLNVLQNAVKFTREGGQITVVSRLSLETDRLLIEIADNGLGMTPTELNTAFTAFSQGEHTGGGHRFGGLGLGLAICRQLVELHAGRIYATSPGRNRGSVFIIELPLGAPEEAVGGANPPRDSAAPVEPSSRPARSILLVEDHVSTRETLKKLLTRRNYEVVAAGTMAEALGLAESRTFDFLVSDVGLPDGDGYQLMAAVRKIQPALQGIALSGYGMEDDLQRSQAGGFATHLVKPVSIGALEKALVELPPASERHFSPPVSHA
jgi:PAS domain S-box-containing protein